MERGRADLTPIAVEEPERKLAAIMATDVVGYSRMMSADEVGTIHRFADARREVIDPIIAVNRGRIFKTMGDGLLVEFPSVVLAVRAALVIQTRLEMHNADQAPERRIVLRIGLHQGDVVVNGEDLLGDGVNIAARLEPLAPPGGLCMSERVREDVAGKIALNVEDGGTRELKNIPHPLHVYFVRPRRVLAEPGDVLRDLAQAASAVPAGAAGKAHVGATEPTLFGVMHPPVHQLALLTPPPPGPAPPGLAPGQTTVLGARPLCLGRVAPNDLVLPSTEVSRTHCRIELVDGVPVVTDLDSSNGTFVDGVRIERPTRLQPGSEIRVGPYAWRYACEDAEPIDAEQTIVLRPAPH